MEKVNLENTYIIKLRLIKEKRIGQVVIGNLYCWCVDDVIKWIKMLNIDLSQIKFFCFILDN